MNLKKYVKITAICYILLFFLAIFANFMVLENYLVIDNAELTVQNIANNDLTFRIGTLFFLIIAILDVIVAWSLYKLFEPVNKEISLLSAWSRLGYTIVLIFLTSLLVIVSYLANNPLSFDTNTLNSLILTILVLFKYGWIIGLSVFGLHLILMGYLATKAKFIHTYLGYALIIAGIGYIFDTLANILYNNYALHADLFQTIVIVFAVPGELALTVWLIVKSFSKKEIKT